MVPWQTLVQLFIQLREKMSPFSVMVAIVFGFVCMVPFAPDHRNPEYVPSMYEPGGLCYVTPIEGSVPFVKAGCYVNVFDSTLGGAVSTSMAIGALIGGAILGLLIGAEIAKHIAKRMREE